MGFFAVVEVAFLVVGVFFAGAAFLVVAAAGLVVFFTGAAFFAAAGLGVGLEAVLLVLGLAGFAFYERETVRHKAK